MDVIVTALGEFVWTSSCAIVNCCLSSGLNALVVFVSFLCSILASGFYKYTISRERMLSNGTNQSATTNHSTIESSIRSPSSFIETTNMDEDEENNEQISDDMIVDTSEDSEEEMETKQIKDIYHLLNNNDLTETDFIDQLQMYGLQIDNETELELC